MSKFMVHDKHGNVWPPQFKSELCDPDSPHSMVRANNMVPATSASNQARAEGKGWSGGTIHHMAKPLLAKAAT